MTYPTAFITMYRTGLICVCVCVCVCVFVVRGPLTVVAPPVAEHRLRTRRLSGQPLRGMWDLPGPGHEPVSPASAGGLSTTAPPGKPKSSLLNSLHLQWFGIAMGDALSKPSDAWF